MRSFRGLGSAAFFFWVVMDRTNIVWRNSYWEQNKKKTAPLLVVRRILKLDFFHSWRRELFSGRGERKPFDQITQSAKRKRAGDQVGPTPAFLVYLRVYPPENSAKGAFFTRAYFLSPCHSEKRTRIIWSFISKKIAILEISPMKWN